MEITETWEADQLYVLSWSGSTDEKQPLREQALEGW